MTKMGAGGSADERFVDVFRSGVLLNRCAAPTRRMLSIALCCRAWQMSSALSFAHAYQFSIISPVLSLWGFQQVMRDRVPTRT